MGQLWRRELTWAACHIPRVWPIQICFRFYSMTTPIDAIKKETAYDFTKVATKEKCYTFWSFHFSRSAHLIPFFHLIMAEVVMCKNLSNFHVVPYLCAVKKDQINGKSNKTVNNWYKKEGRIHGYPSRVWVGRGSDKEGHLSVWAGAVSSKTPKT